MDEYAFWQQKLIQFFHDPPGKPFAMVPHGGGHTRIAARLFEEFFNFHRSRDWRLYYNAPDRAATGADRPNLTVAWYLGKKGLGSIQWPRIPVVTHPLSPGYRLQLPLTRTTVERQDQFEGEDGTPRDFSNEAAGAASDVAKELEPFLPDWKDPQALKRGFVALWRRYRDELVKEQEEGGKPVFDPLWQELPADTRCPDHSIWDHLRVTTALAFLNPHKMTEEPRDEGAREPWLLRVALGPVQAFITQSRTSRDLWMSSYLVADLTWHAMRPIVERYGPDCIVYPDLRGNPRADCWLAQQKEDYPGALPDNANPSTFAAILPEAFVALVPHGGEGHLKGIQALAQEAKDSVEKRWKELANTVREWLEREIRIQGNTWKEIWDRQHRECPLHVTWVAVPWLPMERIDNENSLRGRALPAQDATPEISAHDDEAIETRERRLAPWLPAASWGHYEAAREVFARTFLRLFQSERGFDYALTHHQLRVRHALRLESNPAAFKLDEPGEKCTMCGLREALHDGAASAGTLGELRTQARAFWSHGDLDPDETGAERLCAICATKRFLVEADQRGDAFNRLWAGMATDLDEFRKEYDDRTLRVPFPSMATIGAQEFIEAVVKNGAYRRHLAAIVDACRRAELKRTSFPDALPRLAALAADPSVRAFLEYDAQLVLFPEVSDAEMRSAARRRKSFEDRGRSDDAAKMLKREQGMRELNAAVEALYREISAERKKSKDVDPGDRTAPNKRVAVIRLDGDNMGELLLGDAERIGACWRDVLHPEVCKRLLEGKGQGLRDAGWLDLLDCKRLMGPSLHAYINRALANFSHGIVPHVVEMEFSGRLIYAGGDDVLCLAPANEAVALASRLQQLFSAAWVVDTAPQDDPWAWRRPGWQGSYDQLPARQRFRIPLCERDAGGNVVPIEFGKSGQEIAAHVCDSPARQQAALSGELLPMLGACMSLSAGIAIGHYKTPMSSLLQRSGALLKFAKESGRRSVGLGHASRGGEKTRFALPWSDGRNDDLTAYRLIERVTEGFRKGDLPGRLPYKLRERALSVRCALKAIDERNVSERDKDEARTRLIDGVFRSCTDGAPKEFAGAARALWNRGIELYGFNDKTADEEGPVEDRYTDGLLFCRELVRGGGDGEDGE